MEKLRLGLVGCGGMGTRHLHGLKELADSPFDNVELAAVCDISRDHAELAAREAESLLGVRPPVFTDVAQMVRDTGDLAAVDVVTDPSTHHTVACEAMDLGLHVLVEKPMAITVGTCRMMVDAATRNGRILSVAENFRRDPSARVVRHLLETGELGRVYMGVYHSLGAGDAIFISPWRHRKERGGFLLDIAVHFTHMIRYQLGDVATVYGNAHMVEPVRRKAQTGAMDYEFYRRRLRAMDAEIEAAAEDTAQALLTMERGAAVNLIVGISGHAAHSRTAILGDGGSVDGFGDRGGRVSLQRRDEEALSQEQLLAAQADLLDPLTRYLFPTGVTDTDPKVDIKLIAYELHEMAEAVLEGRRVEVDGACGLKDVAALYAVFESATAGRAVSMEEVESCRTYTYQAEIDAAIAREHER
jgi:predicted dehydrogenase